MGAATYMKSLPNLVNFSCLWPQEEEGREGEREKGEKKGERREEKKKRKEKERNQEVEAFILDVFECEHREEIVVEQRFIKSSKQGCRATERSVKQSRELLIRLD